MDRKPITDMLHNSHGSVEYEEVMRSMKIFKIASFYIYFIILRNANIDWPDG
mgnify:FL=1